MSGSCPYCGAKLNYGIKFCVVCGRPIAGPDTGKAGAGGMRSGIRPADVTRRLDDLMTVARFRRSKRSTHLDRGMRWFSLNAVSIAVGVCLFFCAVKMSLDGGLVSKKDKLIAPLEHILSNIGIKDNDAKKKSAQADKDKKASDANEGAKPASTKKKSKSRSRSGKRADHG